MQNFLFTKSNFYNMYTNYFKNMRFIIYNTLNTNTQKLCILTARNCYLYL